MKKLLIPFGIFIFSLFNHQSQGQSSCPKKFIEGKYKIENSLKMDINLSQEFTLIGMNKEALMEEDKYIKDGVYGIGDPKCLIAADSDLRILPAITYFYQTLKKNNIVILNECHNFPQNRVFFYTILDSLKYFGFNSLFIETLCYTPNDSLYQHKEGVEHWGYYTIENVFHEVIHKCEKLDYQLYSYEIDYPRKIDTLKKNNAVFFINKSEVNWVPIEADSLLLANFFSDNDNIQREAEHALNIYQKITRNKLKKAFIYCGYTHAFKSNYLMAGMLKHLLNKDVYTIDQMYLREHTKAAYENPLYTKYATVPYPFVIVDEKNNPIHLVKHIEKNYVTDSLFNMAIAAPRSIYVNNRPTWLELNGDRKRYNLKKFMELTDLNDFLVTVYDFDKKEPSEAVTNTNEPIPVDVFQVEGKGGDYDLILRPGKEYRLKIIKDGAVKIDKIINAQ